MYFILEKDFFLRDECMVNHASRLIAVYIGKTEGQNIRYYGAYDEFYNRKSVDGTKRR